MIYLRDHELSTLAGCIFLTLFVCSTIQADPTALSKYEPLAIDESVKVLRTRPRLSSNRGLPEDFGPATKSIHASADLKVSDLHSILSAREVLGMDHLPGDHPDDPIGTLDYERPRPRMRLQSQKPRIIPNDSSLENEKVYSIPLTETPALTKLITANETPTFMANKVIRPLENKEPGSKVLARYNVIMPFYVPSMRYKHKESSKAVQPQEHLIKETFTGLTPVRNVTEIDHVYQAERIPQKVETDFVIPKDNIVPPVANDVYNPRTEKLVDTVRRSFN